MTYRIKTHHGFSLLELMFAIAILAILLGFGVPAFREIINNNRLVTQNNELVTALNVARSEALRRPGNVTVCASEDAGASCSDDTDWSGGWIVFVDNNADGTRTAPEEIVQVWPAMEGFTLDTGTRGFVRYNSSGRSAFAETFTLLKPGCTGDRVRQVSVALTGRVSTVKANCPG